MAYLICDKCGGYYELQDGEAPDDPQNLRFWDTENEVFECFDSCQCGGKLRYVNSLYGKSYESNKSENKIKESVLNFWNKQNRNGKIVLILLGLFLIIASIFGALGKIYPDTSTPQGYLDYHNVKMGESNEITLDVANIIKKYNSNLISPNNAVESLNVDKQKMDRLIQDFENIKVPLQYKKHHELIVSALKDNSNAITNLINAIKNNDSSAIDAAITSMKSSIDKVEQAVKELKRINNIK